MLAYAEKLTVSPSQLQDTDIDALRNAGWEDAGIYEATALTALFNLTGRLEAASGLPPDVVPAGSRLPEARRDSRSD